MRKRALIVVDMQYDFVYGSLGSDAAREIVPRIVDKIKEFKEENNLVIFTRDTHVDYFNTLEGYYLPIEHCVFDTAGWDYVKEIKPYVSIGCEVLKSTFGYNGSYVNTFKALLKEQEIEICGLCTDICVITNALILRTELPNTIIRCDPKCCAGTTLEKHKAALNVMESCQIEIINR